MTTENIPACADNGRVEDVDPVNSLDDQNTRVKADELDEDDLDDPAEDPAEGGEGIEGFDEEDVEDE